MSRKLLRAKNVSGGDYLLVPRTTHVILTALALVMGVLLWLPSLFLMKKSFVFLTGYGSLTLATGLLLWGQVVPRGRRRYVEAGPNGTTWYRIPNGSDIGYGVMALLAAITATIAGAMLTKDIIQCPDRTTQGLCQMTCGENFNGTGVTDWTTQYRVPYFATNILTYQSCLDDYALTIFALVVYFVATLVMVVVALEQYFARDWTVEVLLRQEAFQAQLAVAKRVAVVNAATARPVGAAAALGEDMHKLPPLSLGTARRLVRIQLTEEYGLGDGTHADDDDDDDNYT